MRILWNRVSVAGGESTWREYLTLPNILKEFNPSLIGYAVKDSLGSQRTSQFNVAEPLGINSDMPFQAELLVKRMRSDKRVDYENDWKVSHSVTTVNEICIRESIKQFAPEHHASSRLALCMPHEPEYYDPGRRATLVYSRKYRVSQEECARLGRVFLMLKYTDITQNTYIQS